MTARIAQIEVTPLRVPLEPPFMAAFHLISSVDPVLVRVRDTEGVQGIGLAFSFGARDARAVLEVARGLAPLIEGGEAVCVERHHANMHGALNFAGAGGPALAALSAIDLALWDLSARRAGMPLWRMLGGARSAVDAYGSGGSLGLADDALRAEVGAFVAAGHQAVKIKGGLGTARDAARLALLRRDFGADLKVAVDANQQFDAKSAIRWARALQEFRPWWIEEPVNAADVEGHARVRSAVDIDVATGETLFGMDRAVAMIEGGGADVLMPNLQRIGGITAWLRVAALAQLRHVRMAAHVHPEFQIHLMCGHPSGHVLECWSGWPWLWCETLQIRNGQALAPEAPGIGFTLDESRVAAWRAD